MHHCQIEWPEVLVEWEVSQIIINIEEEGILKVLWWSLVTHPVQFIYMANKIVVLLMNSKLRILR